MIPHPRSFLDQLDPESERGVYLAALRILEKAGFVCQSEEACRLLADGGARARMAERRVLLPPDMVERCLALAPRRWILHARDPRRSVEVGGGSLLVAPGYGSPSVADARGRRRGSTMADFEAFASLAWRSGCIDVTGGMLVEPLDVPPALRPLETTRALIERSDKPFFGSVAGGEGARESIGMARILFPDMDRRAVLIGLVNVNSPLRLDPRMAEALLEYARAGQPVLLTPGILMGVTAPVTATGALIQALAELLACVVLVQTVRPGSPVMVGTGGFGADLRSGGPGFGRPENALGTILGAQMARRLGLPFRCSGGVTGSWLPDCRSGYERMMTAMAAWMAGAHLCLQGAGTLDRINAMSFEQFLMDVEMWDHIGRIAEGARTDSIDCEADLIASLPSDFLGEDHTVEHMRREIRTPLLAPPWSYDEWMSAGSPDCAELARCLLAKARQPEEWPDMDAAVRRELDGYLASRRRTLA